MIPPISSIQTGVVFDSRDPFYRSPTGAVPAGTEITLSLLIPRGECPLRVCVYFSEDGTPAAEQELIFEGNIRQYQRWTGKVSVEKTGIYWYTFRVETPKETRIYGRDAKNRPLCGQENPAAWQITAYDPRATLPKGWAGGTFYQIFPDRFFRDGRQTSPAGKEYATLRKPHELPNWKREPNGDLDTTDFFGGNLKGIEKKLDYLQGLGVTALYLNPIFEAHSNHRYDTANYELIDPFLGSEKDFRSLCNAAHKRGIRVLLDGVFSHTGADSIYFNRYGTYPQTGAYQSKESPYYPWFRFRNWPDDYAAWWGIRILPEVDETNPDYLEYITGENGILRRWLRAGADGWRFDVADELPDGFLDAARTAIKAENPNALCIGEVWEDATTKEAYGTRRRYLLGDQLDSVMNYVLKDGLLRFLQTGDSEEFSECLQGLAENYPPYALHCAMNLIGTHDTPRALTVLGNLPLPKTPEEQVKFTLSPQVLEEARKRLKLAYLLLFTLPGIPSVYYGDEAGMQGGHDPLNRCFYPWGKEDEDLVQWVAKLGAFRRRRAVFREGDLKILYDRQGLLIYRREDGIHRPVTVAVNASLQERSISLENPCSDVLTNQKLNRNTVLPPLSALLLDG